MKTVDILLTQLDYTHKSISLNLQGVDEKEAIEWPSSGGNCINWVTGHILKSRITILELLNQKIPFEAELDCYRREEVAKEMQSDFLSISILKKLLADTQLLICSALEKHTLPEEVINEIARLVFHEAYHAGQIGLLRRVIGKVGQIM